MSALRILKLPQQLTYKKGILMHNFFNNNCPDYLAQLFINDQSHCVNSRNDIYVPRPRLDLFKTSIIIIIMYIYDALINALGAHIIHINLNMIFYTHIEHSPTKIIYIKYYKK